MNPRDDRGHIFMYLSSRDSQLAAVVSVKKDEKEKRFYEY